MGKVKILYFCSLLDFFFQKCLLSSPLMLQMNFILIPYFDWLLGPLKEQIFERKNL